METLEQIKNDYAKTKGCSNWYELEYYEGISNKDWENVCVIAQKECLRRASENAEVYALDYYDFEVNKDTIINENNIIK